MKKRILVSNIIIILMLIISRPDNIILFYSGLPLIILGEMTRILSSASIRKNKELAKNGIYSATRNPLYFGTFLIMLGILIQLFSITHIFSTIFIYLITIVSFCIIYLKTIKAEEEFLLSRFGNEYKSYYENTPVLIPDFKKINEFFKKENFSKESFKKNKEYRGITGIILIEIIIILKIWYIK